MAHHQIHLRDACHEYASIDIIAVPLSHSLSLSLNVYHTLTKKRQIVVI